jgi:CBS domain-containing protein
MATQEQKKEYWPWFLHKYKAKDLISHQQLVFVDAKDTILEALRTLATNKILAVPVYDEEGNKFIGSLDVLDAVAYLTFLQTVVPRPEQIKELHHQRVHALLNISKRNEWTVLSDQSGLLSVMVTMLERGAHRVALEDEKGKIQGLVTQFRIIEWLHEMMGAAIKPAITERLQKTRVKDFQHAKVIHPVVKIKLHKSLLDGFRKIYLNNVSALAIVNTKGQIMGTLSASDVKSLAFQDEATMMKTLRSSLMDHFNLGKEFTLTCKEDDTVETVLDTFATTHVHRLWIVDDNQVPKGVLSLSDVVLEVALSEAPMGH